MAAACTALALLTLVGLPASPAAADAPAAMGWWSQASSLPPPPDVSSDGLYAQGGPSGPVAISALRFSLPEGATPKKLMLVPNGVASPGAVVQVCPLKPDAAQFKPAHNGAWADAPAYDCAGKKAVTGTADDSGALTFDVAALADGGTLAVAVIANGAGDRVPIAKPDASALTTVAAASDSTTADSGSTYAPADTAPSTATDSSSAYASSGSGSVALPQLGAPTAPVPDASTPSATVVPSVTNAGSIGPDHPLAIAAASPHDLATRLGGLAAIAILIAALIAYSLGYGLLGGRFVDS